MGISLSSHVDEPQKFLHVLSDPSNDDYFFPYHLCRLLDSFTASDINVSTRDLNQLVMDYLVIEGFKTSAEEFSKEAGLNAPVDLESIESRMTIREALQRGDVGEAITRVNDLNPEVSKFRAPVGCGMDGLGSRDACVEAIYLDLCAGKKGFKLSCTTLRPVWSLMRHQTKTSVFNMISPRAVSLHHTSHCFMFFSHGVNEPSVVLKRTSDTNCPLILIDP